MSRIAANDNHPAGAAIRFRVEPRLVPAAKAARRLHLTETEFEANRTALHHHGFPLPCPVIGHYDLVAIDSWLDRMHGVAANSMGLPQKDAASLVAERLAAIG